jgi:isopropylmalate/homocitrate/citramalate synthase
LTHVSRDFLYLRCSLKKKFPAAVLGIGERVGITPLGGLVACLYAANPDYVKSKYNLGMLREIENLVAEAVEVNVPFSNPITYAHSFLTQSVG